MADSAAAQQAKRDALHDISNSKSAAMSGGEYGKVGPPWRAPAAAAPRARVARAWRDAARPAA